MIKKLLPLITALTTCIGTATVHAAPSILVDVQTGKVLASEQAFDRWSPASLTKLMTAYVTFREIAAGGLTASAPVRMSTNAANNPPSKMGYKVGAIMTVENALEMLIVKSANDVAVALSEAVSGTEANFVARMNAEAQRLGMTDTNFINPNGLHDEAQYTTARDLGILATAIRREFPQFDPLFAAEAIRTGEDITETYNLLLGRYDGADGMKTGFVCASGFNMVASATRQNRTLITVVLGETSQKERAEKAVSLLEQGFTSSQTTDAPALKALERPANASTTIANMRPIVCTPEAEAARWDGRQIEGNITFATAAIKPRTRAAKAIQSGLGGAVGISKAAAMLNGQFIAAFPFPQPRPERPSLLDDDDTEKFGLRPGFDVPVPIDRPQG
ncbi:MAG: D-alanyl-D-alanine carboxypeptidase family protein [Ahrensia sp.]|nr:D-alanyl-D-alanine carboxypeptidase family protein [Ahrensia sp.]